MKKLLLVFALLSTACASPYAAKQIETTIETKGRVGDYDLGLDNKGDVVLQKKEDAATTLHLHQRTNEWLEEQIAVEDAEIKYCRKSLAKRAGLDSFSSGSLAEELKPIAEIKEEFGLDEADELVVVQRRYYVKALKKERKYEKALRKTLKLAKRQLEECEFKLASH